VASRARIILLDGDKELAQDRADANGEWIIIVEDPPLSAGPHELRVIQHVEGHAPVTSDQVVVAIVPDQKQSGPEKKTLVMIAPPAGAATLVQPPSAAGVPKSGDLVMSTLDYDEGGHVTVTGKATPGAVVRAYINAEMVAEGQAAADGSWRLVPAKPVEPGITSFGSTGSPRMASPWPASSCRSSAFPCRRLRATANAWLSCVATVSGTLRAHTTATASATP
jgi:hypothetical protein